MCFYVLYLPPCSEPKTCCVCVRMRACVKSPCTVTTHHFLLHGCGVCTNRPGTSVLTPVMSEVQELRGIFFRGILAEVFACVCLPLCTCVYVCVCVSSAD